MEMKRQAIAVGREEGNVSEYQESWPLTIGNVTWTEEWNFRGPYC